MMSDINNIIKYPKYPEYYNTKTIIVSGYYPNDEYGINRTRLQNVEYITSINWFKLLSSLKNITHFIKHKWIQRTSRVSNVRIINV